MINSFETTIAEKHGMSAAVVHQEILRWCAYNEKEETAEVFVDGKYWMYTSHARLQKHLSYMSVSTVRRALTCLNDAGLIESRTRASQNPNALLYRALTHEHTPYAQNEHTYVQNEHTPYVQNEHSEHKEVEHRQINKKAAAGVRAREEQPKQEPPTVPAPTIKTPADIVIAFYESAGATRPPDDTIPWQRDIEQCEEILAAGYTADQIIGVPGMRSHTEISSFRYCSVKVLKQIFKHKPKPAAPPSLLDGVTDTDKRIDEWAGSVPASDEERQAVIDACRETLRAARGEAPAANTSRKKRNKPKAEPVPAPEPITITDDDLPF